MLIIMNNPFLNRGSRFVLLLLLAAIGFHWNVSSGWAQTKPITVYDIPSPRAGETKNWIVDRTGEISAETITHINLLCEEVHQKLNKEMSVVVVDSVRPKSLNNFGLELFNHWGIGKWGFGGTFRNDGILLIVATKDRRAEILLGEGIDDDSHVRTAQQIIDDVIVPNFKAGDAGSGLYEGIRACASRLLGVADLDSPEMLPSVAASGTGVRANVRQQGRRGIWPWMPLILGLCGLGGVGSIFAGRYYWRYRSRYCPKCQQEMALLCETQDDHFLADPEVIEERLGSVNYDVWACLPCNEITKVRYGRWLTRYSKCPECWYVTVLKIQHTMVHATYSHGGQVRVVEECKSCNFYRTFTYSTPMKIRIKTTSGGGSWSSGGGGRGFGGGSGFGGGRSAGRGAGGGW